jgi:hypothetical protein
VIRFILALFALLSTLSAEPSVFTGFFPNGTEDERPEPVVQKVLYLSYADIPERVFKGEIFPVTVKTLSTIRTFDAITYAFKRGQGIKLLNSEPERRTEGPYFLDTFYFLATGQVIRTPDIHATLLVGSDVSGERKATLSGKRVESVVLNPDRNYAHILADSFRVDESKTNRYNDKYNILVFKATAEHCYLKSFSLNNVKKQGIESIEPAIDTSLMTYYAIIPRKLETLNFSFFNLKSRRFENVSIPIIVDDDTVSTQSDLRPIEHRHTLLKIAAASVIALIGFILLLVYRLWWYLPLLILPGIYIAYVAVPTEDVCVKEESPIYLLPMENGTVFKMTQTRQTYEVQGSTKKYTKIKLDDNKIGWVKNEDLCAY